MSEIKVVRRPAATSKPMSITSIQPTQAAILPGSISLRNLPDVIAIGASAGGPLAIQKLFNGLNNDFIIPIVIVQHIEPVFAEGFAQWLELTTGKKVFMAFDGMELKQGMIVLPPGDVHLSFRDKAVLKTPKTPPDRGLRPSVNHLFTSIANTYGPGAVGIILSGMGNDGVEGLRLMRNKGAVTIAQNAESSMIHGMPGEAIKTGAAKYNFSIEQMINYLNEINRQRTKV